MSPLLSSALDAHKKSNLLQWTIEYFEREERNKGIADHIKKRDVISVELMKYPLRLLKRVEGPQNGEVEMESIDVWTKRVDEIATTITKNVLPDPLIVTDFWDTLEIADGNHRHEALLKSGYNEYWTIFLLTKEESSKKVRNR